MAARGFVLVPTYRMTGGRAVVHLWGVLEDGTSFLVRDRRPEPGFFVGAGDAETARTHGARAVVASDLRSMAGAELARVTVTAPADAPALRGRLEAAGVECFEADVRFAMRYCFDRGVRSAIAIEGPWTAGAEVARLYEDPELEPAKIRPQLRVLSLDIETSPHARRLLSVALHGPGVGEVMVIGPAEGLPPYVTAVASELELLERFVARVRAIDPDVITGWNVIAFDLEVLARRARALGTRLVLGRGPAPLSVRIDRSFWGASRASIDGRVVLDGVDLLRQAFVKVDDHRLDTVARAILGEGKTITDVTDRGAEIERQYREDRAAFCRYNLKDAELVSRILEAKGLIRLAVERSLLTGMPLDRVGASIASLDALYLPELHRRGFVAPSVHAGAAGDTATAGGALLSPVPGLHRRVLVFDFKSLYPSVMRTFNIDPLTYIAAPAPGTDLIRTPAGACFDRPPGILPAILGQLLAVRGAARQRGDDTASYATKILMNSFYGVLATSACRFHSTPIANAITRSGQAILHWTRDRVEELGHRVLYGDTDSVFVASGAGADDEAWALGRALGARLNRELAAHLSERYGVESRLELELEGLYLQLFLPHTRDGVHAAYKRYAGLVDGAGGPEVVFVGMESVRRDWTAAAKEFQRELYERVFAGAAVTEFIRDFIASLRSGARDHQLVYRKSLRKSLASYTATTPPHVQAARRGALRGRVVEYVMTRAGPQPATAPGLSLDYGHYVEKQLRPIAEAVLPVLGRTWDEIVGNPRQLDLF